jgi:hypothetical protein
MRNDEPAPYFAAITLPSFEVIDCSTLSRNSALHPTNKIEASELSFFASVIHCNENGKALIDSKKIHLL